MKINYDNKKFRSVSNTDNGEVSGDTLFHYHQEGELIWGEYSGGEIVRGNLIAKVLEDGRIDMRYQHLNAEGEFMLGKCLSTPSINDERKIRLEERWQWLSGDKSEGSSIVEEV